MSKTPRNVRYVQLDGLRGLAALAVVLGHLILTVPAFGKYFMTNQSSEGDEWLPWAPFEAIWGQGPVWVFFALSGFVVVLPVLRRGRGFDWVAYYPKRILRLYLPAIASLLVAALWVVLVAREGGTSVQPWLRQADISLSPELLLRDAVLLLGVSHLNGPLWSLRSEVLFSLLLPLYYVYAMVARRAWLWKFVPPILVMFLGATIGSGWLVALPIFALGSLLAAEREEIVALYGRLPRGGRILAWVVAAVLLLSAQPVLGIPAAPALVGIGAALLVALFVASPAATAFGELRVNQWLGRVSFSLYLTHLPLLIAVSALLGPERLYLSIPISLVGALLLAQLFYTVVERPSHRFAQFVGGKITSARSKRSQTEADSLEAQV